MAIALCGVVLAAFVQFKTESHEDINDTSALVIILIGISAILQALQGTLVQQCVKEDPQLSAFTVQCGMCLWKLFWLMLVMPFLDMAPSPEGIYGKSALESIRETLTVSVGSLGLVGIQALLCGLQAFLGVACIKEGNAVLKQTATLLVVPCMYVVKVLYYAQQIKTNEISAVLLIVFGTIWFISTDRAQDSINKDNVTFRVPTQFTEASDEE